MTLHKRVKVKRLNSGEDLLGIKIIEVEIWAMIPNWRR